MATVPVIAEHIEMTPGVRGGKPRIKGSRIAVQDIAIWHVHQGRSVEEILKDFPSLTQADIHAALAFYFDHQEEVEDSILRGKLIEEQFRASGTELAEQLRQRLSGPHSERLRAEIRDLLAEPMQDRSDSIANPLLETLRRAPRTSGREESGSGETPDSTGSNR